LATIYAPIAIDPTRVGMVAIAAGLAVVDALAGFEVNCALKWPNDVLVTDRKLAGLLVSTRLGKRVDASVGIGLNIWSAPPGAIALCDLVSHLPPAEELLESIRGAMIPRWTDLEAGRFDAVAERWNEVAAGMGRTVSAHSDREIAGRLIGIDEWGRLRIESDAGEIQLSESEIVRGPRSHPAAPYTSQ
jgi:BirA family biotin operon repressor/biotin-[acetyl-CoA-carboxylase] ligase